MDVKSLRRMYMNAKLDDPRGPMNAFVEFANNHEQHIRDRDRSYFEELERNGACPVHIKPSVVFGLGDEITNHIWDFVNTLLTLAKTISQVPDKMLASIENIAAECASELEGFDLEGGGTQTQMMQQMFKVTTKVMPKLLKEMGLDVNDKDMQDVTSNMSGALGKMSGLGPILRQMMEDDDPSSEQQKEIQKLLE